MLFQQNGKIEVIVRKQDDGASVDNIGNEEVSPEEAGSQPENNSYWGSLSKNRKQRIIKTNITQTISMMRQVGLLGLNYYHSTLSARHGDAHYQDIAQRNWEIADDAMSIVSSVGMGATYGSWGGPVGAVVGILTNLASTTASIGFKYAGRERDLSIKQFKENNGIQYQRARAGINLTTGRLR